jgi:RluA family pseudouridine synthase
VDDPAPVALVLRSRVPPQNGGQTLIGYLRTRFPYHDQAGWRAQIAAGRLSVDGVVASGDVRLRPGATVAYTRVAPEPFVDDRIDVLHEDEHLLVVDKPAHLPMHADGPFVQSTLVNLLRQRRREAGLHLVHRLDRETSGVCVLPRTPAARAALHAQFAGSNVRKEYAAVVHGVVASDFRSDLAVGRARDSTVPMRRAAGERASAGLPACTCFAVLARGSAATLLRCEPRTGRTHQIRVHLEAAGHPIVGDKLYGRTDEQFLAFVRAVKESKDARRVPGIVPDRQLLHATALSFVHPATGEPVTFRSPPPPLFAEWLQRSPGSPP